MKIISINCPNCAKSVDIDLDNISTYCSHCGSKLMLDITQLQELLKEKEKTKQKEIEANMQYRLKQMDIDEAIRREANDNVSVKEFLFWTIFIILAVFGIIGISVFGESITEWLVNR